MKIFGDYAVDCVISYAASLISASGSGLTKPFMELLQGQSGSLKKITNFLHYENGGIGGEINGDSVVAGTTSFMWRTGIKIPSGVNIKNAVYLAINHELAGVFAINYNALPSVRNALNLLLHHGMTPVLAIRDFNVTPDMLETRFKISTDVAELPKIEERLALSNPDRLYTAKPAAVIGREGLHHFAETIAAARNLKRVTKLNLWLTIISVAVGMMLMFYLAYTHSTGPAVPANVAFYMFLWMLPQFIVSGWVNS